MAFFIPIPYQNIFAERVLSIIYRTESELGSQPQSSMWVPQDIDDLLKQTENANNDESKATIFNSLNIWTQSLDKFTSDVLEVG